MVKNLNETPGFTEISPSILQQDVPVLSSQDPKEKQKQQKQPPEVAPSSPDQPLVDDVVEPSGVDEVSEEVQTGSIDLTSQATQLSGPQAEATEMHIPSFINTLADSFEDPEPSGDLEPPVNDNVIPGIQLGTQKEAQGEYKSLMSRLTAPETSSVSAAKGLKKDDIPAVSNYIAEEAKARGIDPAIAIKVAKSEGLAPGVWQSTVKKNGRLEPSYGPFQLLKGGPGTGFPKGMGNDFEKQTGLDPADPKNMKPMIDFALDRAKQKGWGAWYGAAKVGVSKWTGIN